MKNKIVKDTLALTVITLISGLLLGVVNDITAGPLPVSRQKKKKKPTRRYLQRQLPLK